LAAASLGAERHFASARRPRSGLGRFRGVVCGHCGRFARCLKETSYPEPLCVECFDALEAEGIPYVATCIECGAEDQF
jgi:hypothetical protein